MKYVAILAICLCGCGSFGDGFRRGYADNIGPALVDAYMTRNDAVTLKNDIISSFPKIPVPAPPAPGGLGDWTGVFLGGVAAYLTGSLGKGAYRAITKDKESNA